MPRCSGTSTFRRVQLLVFKVAGKSGGWSLTVHKNEWSGLVESLMWPTKRVTRLRATNNNCLYPFSSLVVLFSLTRPSSFLFADTRASSSSLSFLPPAPFPLLSFAEVIRTRAERSWGIYRGQMPLPSELLVPVPKFVGHCRR